MRNRSARRAGDRLTAAELQRFHQAQERGGAYQQALSELRSGRKRGHWIWFVFPQIAGLGFSEMSRRYAIGSLAEAEAYLADPVLGPRLIACSEALLALPGSDPVAVMGEIDAIKLRSSMTLFARAPDADPAFSHVLNRYFGGVGDPATEHRLLNPCPDERCAVPVGGVARGLLNAPAGTSVVPMRTWAPYWLTTAGLLGTLVALALNSVLGGLLALLWGSVVVPFAAGAMVRRSPGGPEQFRELETQYWRTEPR